MAEVIMISCPLCGMARVLEKTGASAIARGITITKVKGRIRFDHMDLAHAPIVQVRERKGGPELKKRMRRGGGTGFILIGGLTLEQMRDNPQYQDLINQIKSTANEIIEILA
ncbi:hypothetical protein ES703_118301 [subsurface metagenome]